jgi:hypothetical protein
MSASQYRRTCEELGVCQGRSNCTTCTHPFAPGAITRHTSAQRRALLRWLRRTALLIATVVGAAFVAGLITGALQ